MQISSKEFFLTSTNTKSIYSIMLRQQFLSYYALVNLWFVIGFHCYRHLFVLFLFLKTMYKYIVWNTLSYLTQYDYRHYHYHQREHYYLLLHNSNIKAFCAPITNMQTSSSVFILLLSLWNVTSCAFFAMHQITHFVPPFFPHFLNQSNFFITLFTGCLLKNN